MTPEQAALDLAVALKVGPLDVDSLEMIHDAMVSLCDARDAQWRAAYCEKTPAGSGMGAMSTHWPDCALNHGGTACDMGPECGSPPASARSVCEVCGREYTEEEGHLTGERGDAACYRLGYEREKAVRREAERMRSIGTRADLVFCDAPEEPAAGPPAPPSSASPQETP